MSRLAVSIIAMIVTVHTHAHAAVLFADDFESGVVNPSWTLVEGMEVIADPTGERPGFVASPSKPDADNFLIKVIQIAIGPGTTVRGFFYENGADDGDDHTWGIDGPDSTTFWVRSGDELPSSFDVYLFDPEGGEVFETSIARTVGWHEFRLEVTLVGTNAFIDGTFVGSSPITMYEFFVLANSPPGGNPVYWDDICIFTGDGASCPAINVNIDIKPGSFPNSINLGSGGTTAVAILGSATSLDVNDIDPDTLTLGTAGVKTVGKTDRTLCSVADVSGDFSAGLEGAPDGFLDLVCHFITMDIVPEAGDTTATISGNLLAAAGGGAIEGTDSVNIVPLNAE